MESLDHTAFFMGDLLDFASDIEEEDDDDYNEQPTKRFGSLNPIVSSFDVLNDPVHGSTYPSLPEFPEEELEWLSNKDKFPPVETFVGILPEDPASSPKHENPVSVLENSTRSSTSKTGHTSTNDSVIMNYCWSLRVPVKARSKQHRRRRHDLGVHRRWWSQESLKKVKIRSSSIGRRCQHCGSEKTPQWRGGPLGPKTLCNACGVRFKSGRLVPEYRPASSPTFCTTLHSNSHRKVLEMRRQKQMIGIMDVKPMERG